MENLGISIKAWATLLGKSEDQVKDLVKPKEDGKALEPSEIETIVSKALSEKFAKIRTETANTSVKNALEKREKSLAAQFEISAYDNWDDLQAQIVEKTKQGEGEKGGANSEMLKQLQSKVSDLTKQIQTEKAATQAAKIEFENKAIQMKAIAIAKSQIAKAGYNVPNDQAAELLLNATLSGKKMKEDNGKIILLGEDGTPMLDTNHNTVDIVSLTDSTFSYFGVKQGGNGMPNPSGGGTNKFSKEQLSPAKYVEMMQQFDKSGDKASAEAYNAAYQELNK